MIHGGNAPGAEESACLLETPAFSMAARGPHRQERYARVEGQMK
jgi:hypothetical protein